MNKNKFNPTLRQDGFKKIYKDHFEGEPLTQDTIFDSLTKGYNYGYKNGLIKGQRATKEYKALQREFEDACITISTLEQQLQELSETSQNAYVDTWGEVSDEDT